MAADDPYEPLFDQYRKELRALYEELSRQKEDAVQRLIDMEGLDQEEAREHLQQEHGPLVHHGRATHLIRKYWLEVARLGNERRRRGEDYLEPLTFLVEDLIDAREDDLVEFLTQIAYWPIGLDENNEWS
jgi:hypothetical protein